MWPSPRNPPLQQTIKTHHLKPRKPNQSKPGETRNKPKFHPPTKVNQTIINQKKHPKSPNPQTQQRTYPNPTPLSSMTSGGGGPMAELPKPPWGKLSCRSKTCHRAAMQKRRHSVWPSLGFGSYFFGWFGKQHGMAKQLVDLSSLLYLATVTNRCWSAEHQAEIHRRKRKVSPKQGPKKASKHYFWSI